MLGAGAGPARRHRRRRLRDDHLRPPTRAARCGGHGRPVHQYAATAGHGAARRHPGGRLAGADPAAAVRGPPVRVQLPAADPALERGPAGTATVRQHRGVRELSGAGRGPSGDRRPADQHRHLGRADQRAAHRGRLRRARPDHPPAAPRRPLRPGTHPGRRPPATDRAGAPDPASGRRGGRHRPDHRRRVRPGVRRLEHHPAWVPGCGDAARARGGAGAAHARRARGVVARRQRDIRGARRAVPGPAASSRSAVRARSSSW
jgi:hypothetical protein